MFEVALVHNGLRPFKRMCDLAVSFDEPIDGLTHLTWGDEARSPQSLSPEYAKPDFYLVQPGSMSRREMEAHVGVSRKPSIFLGFVRAEIIQNHVKLHILGITGDNLIHEIEKLPATFSVVMPGLDMAGCHLQRAEQSSCAMSLVPVRKARKRLAVRQPQPPLSPLQSLDARLLIYAKHNSVLRRRQIQRHNIRGLGRELRVGAYAPTVPPHKMDPVCAQHAPYMGGGYTSKSFGQQIARPGAVTLWRRFIQHVENAFLSLLAIAFRGSRSGGIRKPCYAYGGETHSPFTYGRGPHTESASDTHGSLSIGRAQDDPGPQHQLLLGRTQPYPAFQRSAVVFRQLNNSSLALHSKS